MPRKKTIDNEKLLKAIESGTTSKDMMAEFGVKTLAQLKALYFDSLTKTGTIKPLPKTRSLKDKEGDGSRAVKVTKRGSLAIPSALIDVLGFRIGDEFTAQRTKVGMILKKS